jgi:hypothetical protein
MEFIFARADAEMARAKQRAMRTFRVRVLEEVTR